MAAKSAYSNETILTIECEKGEHISRNQQILLPLIDHSFKECEVIAIYKDWQKYRKKGSLNDLNELETAEVIFLDVDASDVKTISTPYLDEMSGNDCVTAK